MDTLAKKILIVEDDHAIGKILLSRLNAEGFITILETNGKEGLETSLKEHPDLIILDLVMPIMDGISMLKELRQDEGWGKNAKVLIMTNLTNDEKLQEAFQNGVFEYLVKANWELGIVVDKIKHMLVA